MHKTLLFFLLLISCEKSQNNTPASNLFLNGRWVLGVKDKDSIQTCFPIPETSFYFRQEQTIQQSTGSYTYTQKYKIFLDKNCSVLGLLNTFTGTYTLSDAIELKSDKTLKAQKMSHSQDKHTVSLHDLKILNLANLLTGEGLQKGQRLCGLDQDWVLYKDVDVSKYSCALGVQTKAFEEAMNILGIDEATHKIVFGKDTTGNYAQYPLVLIEEERKEWYKQSS